MLVFWGLGFRVLDVSFLGLGFRVLDVNEVAQG